ncbi:hypothetical protein ABEB36_015161 [Hypothenemus hampei]|uniref:Uncharacterized protein n=1 Tax=Hypothenemus hampei TaxID=57062 RepID=A0ABD1E0V7_HYPHA
MLFVTDAIVSPNFYIIWLKILLLKFKPVGDTYEKNTLGKNVLNTQPSGSAPKATWELMTNLSWLDHYFKKRRTKSTLDSQNSSSVDISDCNNQENSQETETRNIYMLESDLEDDYSFQTTVQPTESNELPPTSKKKKEVGSLIIAKSLQEVGKSMKNAINAMTVVEKKETNYLNEDFEEIGRMVVLKLKRIKNCKRRKNLKKKIASVLFDFDTDSE